MSGVQAEWRWHGPYPMNLSFLSHIIVLTNSGCQENSLLYDCWLRLRYHPDRSHCPGRAAVPFFYIASAHAILFRWIWTIRPGICLSERVTANALRHTLAEFLADSGGASILTKFLRERLDLSAHEGLRLVREASVRGGKRYS